MLDSELLIEALRGSVESCCAIIEIMASLGDQIQFSVNENDLENPNPSGIVNIRMTRADFVELVTVFGLARSHLDGMVEMDESQVAQSFQQKQEPE